MLYLIRHAETSWNRAPKRFQGHLEAPLSEAGIRSADSRSSEFSGFVKIYSSPAFRCRKTIEHLCPQVKISEVTFDERLREIDNGWFGGNTADEVRLIDEGNYQQWIDTPHLARPGGGESLIEMATRVQNALNEISDREAEEAPVLVVTHGGPIRTLLCGKENLHQFHECEVTNLQLFECNYRMGEFSVESLS